MVPTRRYTAALFGGAKEEAIAKILRKLTNGDRDILMIEMAGCPEGMWSSQDVIKLLQNRVGNGGLAEYSWLPHGQKSLARNTLVKSTALLIFINGCRCDLFFSSTPSFFSIICIAFSSLFYLSL
jgi:hypothetical protein